MVFPQQAIIGQTWDWAQHVEDTSVIMEIVYPSGHKILQLTEAGIIGKIGLNNRGMGQTLNILWVVDKVLTGVPIHILLRAVLETRTLGEARNTIARSGHGKASNMIVAQSGRAFDVEFDGDKTNYHEIVEPVYTHTNHFLHTSKPGQLDDAERANSLTRYNTSLSKVTDFSPQTMVDILSDRSHGENAILSSYQVDTQIEMGYCGTVATLVMDLKNGILKVRKGNPLSQTFDKDSFIDYSIDINLGRDA